VTSRDFGKGDIPESPTYVYPRPRNRLLIAGIMAAVVVVALTLGAIGLMGKERMVVGGLSAAHANFGNDCESCHAGGSRVTNEKCAGCHEESSDAIGAYSFAMHYAYRSGDFRRAAARDREQTCGACHREHRGRTAPLTRAADAECVSCHGPSSGRAGEHAAVTAFDVKHHPQFEAIGKTDDVNLKFTHDHHVREVAKAQKLESSEQACRYCHTASPGGASFQPIRFAQHCQGCHTLGDTDWSPLVGAIDAPRPGVVKPELIRALGGPGVGWTRAAGTLDFQEMEGKIRKRGLVHEDPWVLFNLRRMRNVLYKDGRLADLIDASPDVPPRDARLLYEEAVETLEKQVAELSATRHPTVRTELEVMRRQLDEVKRRLQNPATPLPMEPFAFDAVASRAVAGRAEYDSVAAHLTRPCQQCHRVESLAIARVKADQRTFVRAKFNHRKHLVQRRCLDCHQRIRIRAIADSAKATPESEDRAAIQNLPGIENCVKCHTQANANAACVTCHDFHPKLSRPSETPLAFQ
jgi:hypothetical protein